jgi:hypothetical protein
MTIPEPLFPKPAPPEHARPEPEQPEATGGAPLIALRGWLRSNRWSLIALAALIPAAVVVSMIPRFFPYLADLPNPEHVDLGEVVRYAGADFELTQLDVFDGRSFDAPAGADIVVATFSVDVVEPGEFTNCDITVVSAESGVEREWKSELFVGDYRSPDRFETYCDLNTVAQYDLQMVFAVPRGEVIDPVVQITSWEALPRVLRLS